MTYKHGGERPNRKERAAFVRTPTYCGQGLVQRFPEGKPSVCSQAAEEEKDFWKKWEERKENFHWNIIVLLVRVAFKENEETCQTLLELWCLAIALYEKSRPHPQRGNLNRVQRCRLSGAPTAESRDMQSCKTMQGVKVPSAPFCQPWDTIAMLPSPVQSRCHLLCNCQWMGSSDWANAVKSPDLRTVFSSLAPEGKTRQRTGEQSFCIPEADQCVAPFCYPPPSYSSQNHRKEQARYDRQLCRVGWSELTWGGF